MKKFLLSLVSLLMFVIGGVWADDAFYTLNTTLEEVATDGNAYANVNNASVGGIDWAFQGNGQQHPWRLGGKALTDVDRVVYNKTAMGAAINSVKLTVGTANTITVNSLKLVVASDPDFADVTDEVAKEFAAESEITFVPSTGTSWAKDSYYKFVFNVSVEGNSNRYVQFSKVEFFAAASEPAAETITLNGIEYELKSENLFVNGSFTDGVIGWKTIGYTTDAVESNFTLTAEGGYDGGAFITTNGAGVGSENTIRQSVAVTPGKTYYFAVRTSGKAPDTSNFNYNALFKMTDAVTENGVIKAFEWPQGAGQTSAEWSTTAIVFTAESDYVGVRMGWNDASSFDGFELYEVEQLTSPVDAAKIEKLAAIDALQIVGDGLFQYSQTAIDAAKAAVNAATTVEEVEAVAMPTPNAPDAEKFYSFQLKEGGNYLAADGGIKLAEKAMGFKFVAAEGGYALTADGTNYVACIGTGTNTWSMGLTEAPYTWVVTCLADGEYTLSKVGKPAECIGVDATTAGSSCFANKPADAKGTWAIAEYVAPVLYNVTVAEGLENGTVVANPVQAEEGETVTLTITPAEGYELDVLTVKAGENDVEVSENTFAMPAADVTVSATFKEQTEPTPEPSFMIEVDYTNKLGIDAASWKGSSGLCATNFAPAITTKDGRTAQLAENYQTNVNATGDLMTQTVTGLPNGTYRVSIYANAFYTSGRGFESDVQDGAEDVCYVFAGTGENRVQKFITARIATSTTENDLRTLENVKVVDGTLVVGLGKAKAGTNWHTVQVFEITALVDATELLATANNDYEAVKDEKMAASVATALAAAKTAVDAELTAETLNAYTAAIEAAQASAAAYKPLTEALAKGEEYKAHSSNTEAIETYDAAIVAVKTAYDEGTVEDLAAAIATVNEALPALAKTQTADGSDLTAFIVNPEVNGADGWTIERPKGGNGPLLGGTSFEFWAGNADPRNEASFDYWQEITGLPNGLYTISADMYNSLNGEGGAVFTPTSGVYAKSGDAEVVKLVDVDSDVLAPYTSDAIVVANGTLRIGVKNSVTPMAARWFVADNFKLTLVKTLDETGIAYEQALRSIEDGKGYRVFTEVGENKFYLTTTGTLVTDTQKAATFTFKAVTINNGAYPTGWNLGCKFTNPSLTGGSTGDVVQNGKINIGNNDRDNWERQVFFLKDGKYAVRATNATGSNWGANTYWTVTNTEAELPNADYSLDMNYVWQIEANVDNRPEAFAKTRNWIAGLQKVYGLATEGSQFISNAKESKEGSYEALVDGDYASFFHSSWSAGADADHYLQVELSEPVEDFYFYMKKRQQNNNNRPTDIVITASNDGETFADVTEITEGLPTGATPLDYTSDKISMSGANKTIRFTVTHTNNEAKEGNGHVFFTASEFYILPSNELTDAAIPYSKCADYTDLTDEDVDVINTIDAQLALLVAKKNLEEDYAALDALVAKIEAYVNATETYTETTEGIAANTTEALNTLKNAAYETADEIAEAKAKAIVIGKEFFAGIKAVKPIEVTEFYIVNPTPVAKGNNDGWEGTGAGDASNGVAEYWNQSGADFHQTVTLPAGNYRLTVVALQRVNQTGVVYAGENKTTIAQVASSVANNRAQAANWFAAGNGKNEVYFTMAEAGDIVIGLTADATTADYWTVWQSFGLEKVGEIYTVSVAETENGTVTADKLVGIEGTKVTLTTTPAEGYELDALSVKAGETDVEVTKNTFVMPAGNVTVSASFKLIPVAADITLASVTYGGEAVTFDENKAATIEGAYDAEKELVVVATAAEDVTVDVAYPTEVGETQIVITVADKDTENFPDNKATYTITFSVATGINALAAEDGKAVIYDMNGRRVSRNAKGVLIINGKKQLVK